MEIQVPGEKMKKLRAEARSVKTANHLSARNVSRQIGKMSSMTQAIPPVPLFYRKLQKDLVIALARGNQDYESPRHLSKESKDELDWWTSYLQRWNGKQMFSHKVEMTIESDASLAGWGARAGDQRTGVPGTAGRETGTSTAWNFKQPSWQSRHLPKTKRGVTIILWLDNTTTVSYVNHLGGTVFPIATEIAKSLWMWCLERNISSRAQHNPGKKNVIADAESRTMRDRSDWKLNPQVFRQIQQLGRVEIDLFASRLSAQVPKYFSWRPDPLSQGTDALVQDWMGMKTYANLGRA